MTLRSIFVMTPILFGSLIGQNAIADEFATPTILNPEITVGQLLPKTILENHNLKLVELDNEEKQQFLFAVSFSYPDISNQPVTLEYNALYEATFLFDGAKKSAEQLINSMGATADAFMDVGFGEMNCLGIKTEATVLCLVDKTMVQLEGNADVSYDVIKQTMSEMPVETIEKLMVSFE